jgi:phosphatidylglycerophosphatase A
MDNRQHETALPSDKSPRSAIQWNHPAVFVATGFWAGRIPWAPGTWGALWGLPLTRAIHQIPQVWAQCIVIALLCWMGVPICTAAVRRFGAGAKDPGAIVLDEIFSMPLVFCFVPNSALGNPAIWIAGFVLHRLFDITKPPPARQLERLPEGLGIMADDWAAGIFAGLALHALHGLGVFGAWWA